MRREKVKDVEALRRRREKWARREERRRVVGTLRALSGDSTAALDSGTLPAGLRRGTFYDVIELPAVPVTPAPSSDPAGGRPRRR